MGAAAVPFIMKYGMYMVAAAAGGYMIHQQRQAAGHQQAELKLAQRQEEMGARDREVQRKRRINAILGSQSAMAAAGGIAMSGSVANVSIEDARLAGEESLVDATTTGLRISALQRRSRSIGALSRARTATSIMQVATVVAGGIGGGGGAPASQASSTAAPQPYISSSARMV